MPCRASPRCRRSDKKIHKFRGWLDMSHMSNLSYGTHLTNGTNGTHPTIREICRFIPIARNKLQFRNQSLPDHSPYGSRIWLLNHAALPHSLDVPVRVRTMKITTGLRDLRNRSAV